MCPATRACIRAPSTAIWTHTDTHTKPKPGFLLQCCPVADVLTTVLNSNQSRLCAHICLSCRIWGCVHLQSPLCIHLTFSLIGCKVVISMNYTIDLQVESDCGELEHRMITTCLVGMNEALLTCHFSFPFWPIIVQLWTATPTCLIVSYTSRFYFLLMCRVFRLGLDRPNTAD